MWSDWTEGVSLPLSLPTDGTLAMFMSKVQFSWAFTWLYRFMNDSCVAHSGGSARALLAVSGDFSGQVLDAAGAAALAQDVSVQWVAASTLPLGGQQEAAFLPNTGRSQLSSAQLSANRLVHPSTSTTVTKHLSVCCRYSSHGTVQSGDLSLGHVIQKKTMTSSSAYCCVL